METLNLKLVFIILSIAVIGGIVGSIIIKEVSKESAALELSKFLENYAVNTRFLIGLYDRDQKEFKIDGGSPTSLEATYYALMAAKNGRMGLLDEIGEADEIFNKIRSYYNPAGYYFEENKEPIASTRMALEIDVNYPQELDQEVDLNWLKTNSLENKNLEESKFDSQYQRDLLEIYRDLGINLRELKMRIEPLYLDYYCDYRSNNISNEDYLRQKYYQASILTYFTGMETISKICPEAEGIEFDKDRLSKISFKDSKDIKDVFQLYYLKKFYNLRTDTRKAFEQIREFYSGIGFKEKLTDSEPNLIGTFYGSSFIQIYLIDYRRLSQ